MMNHRNEFLLWYFNEFQESEAYRDMVLMVENSPWHRERNVGVHTDMVVSQYLARACSETWMNAPFNQVANDRQFLLGAFAAAFHDVAKPGVVQYKESEERGNYKAFNGHEKVSARMWENWALTNWAMLVGRFGFNAWDMYKVGWMIEHHLPWALKDQRKVDNLSVTALRCGIEDAFSTLLMSDTTGRISDDADEKYEKSLAWLDNWHDHLHELQTQMPVFYANEVPTPGPDQPRLVMPVAPSGSGKTTLFSKKFQDEGYGHFSLDEMRYFWAAEENGVPDGLGPKELYSYCWGYCNDHEKEFKQHWQSRYTSAVKRGVNLYVDATNLSAKARRFFLVEAERHGYWTTAWMLPTPLQTVYDRQKTRRDKDVDYRAVTQQHFALALPQYGEFDEIFIHGPVE